MKKRNELVANTVLDLPRKFSLRVCPKMDLHAEHGREWGASLSLCPPKPRNFPMEKSTE